MYCLFFFKRKTAYELRISDWSSDVCSSDLISGTRPEKESLHHFPSKRGSRRSRAPRHAKELIGVRKPKLGESCQTPDIDDRAAVTPQQKKRGLKPKPVVARF